MRVVALLALVVLVIGGLLVSGRDGIEPVGQLVTPDPDNCARVLGFAEGWGTQLVPLAGDCQRFHVVEPSLLVDGGQPRRHWRMLYLVRVGGSS